MALHPNSQARAAFCARHFVFWLQTSANFWVSKQAFIPEYVAWHGNLDPVATRIPERFGVNAENMATAVQWLGNFRGNQPLHFFEISRLLEVLMFMPIQEQILFTEHLKTYYNSSKHT